MTNVPFVAIDNMFRVWYIIYVRRGQKVYSARKGARMSSERRVLWIVDSEEVADVLAAFGEGVTVWNKRLTDLKLEQKDDIEFRVLIPFPLLGVGLSFLRDNKFVSIAVVSPKRPTIPWWAYLTELMLPYFCEKVWIIRFNPLADLTQFLRKAK